MSLFLKYIRARKIIARGILCMWEHVRWLVFGITLIMFLPNSNVWAHINSKTHSTTRPAKTQPTRSGRDSKIMLKMPVHKRLPIPPTRELARANDKLQAYFVKKYPLDTNMAEYKFYMSLFRHYVGNDEGSHHPVMRYAAMMAIVRLAPLQLDPETTFETITALARKYRIHKYRMVAQASQRMVRIGNMRPEIATMLSDQLVVYTHEAIRSLHFESAERMARLGLTLAAALRNPQDENTLILMLARARLAAPLSDRFEQAKKRLAAHPDAPAANTTVGLFLACFTKHRMQADKHLLLSGDPKLVSIAQADKDFLASGNAPRPTMIALAHQWLDIAHEHEYRHFRQPIRKLAKRMASTALQSIDRDVLHALKNAQYEQAQALLHDAIDITTQLNIAGFSRQIPRWQSTSKRLAKLRDNYREAIKAMNDGKDTDSDYLAIGEYLCFGTGRWKDGLPYLRRSKNGRIKQAAVIDISRPKSAHSQKALGDMWWRIANKYKGIERYNIRLRATYWYDWALQKLHGSAATDMIYRKLALKQETF